MVSTRLVHWGFAQQNFRNHSLDQTHLKQKMFTFSPIWTESFWKCLKWRHGFNNLIGFHKSNYPANKYLLKVNHRNSRTMCEICSKLINTPEGSRYWRRSGVFIFANFEQNSHDSSIFIVDFEHANIGWFYWRLHARFIDYYAQS